MARARASQQAYPQGNAQNLNDRISAYLKNPLNFPPELGQWVRSQIVRNPTVKIDPYQLPNLDKKHVVGATNEPAFQNSWAAYGAGFDVPFFYKDNQARVFLQGVLALGTLGTPAFTLPVGYRPLGGQVSLAAIAGTTGAPAIARIDVLASGPVTIYAASNAFVSLSGLSFRIS